MAAGHAIQPTQEEIDRLKAQAAEELGEDALDQTPLVLLYRDRELFWAISADLGVSEGAAAIALAAWIEARGRGRAISYSRDQHFYRNAGAVGDKLFTYANVVGGVDELHRLGLIHHHRVPQATYAQGWRSSFRGTDQLVQAVSAVMTGRPMPEIVAPRQPVVIRGEDGNPLPLPGNARTERMTRQMNRINEALLHVDIRGPRGRDLRAPCSRIFNLDLKRGGRAYASGGLNWQQMKKEKRHRPGAVAVDGEPVQEVDFGALHPTLLYVQAGETPPAGDPYLISGWGEDWRDLTKFTFNVALNARCRSASRAVVGSSKEIRALAEPGTQKAIGCADLLIDNILAQHRPIADMFNNDWGVKLQNIDSRIAMSVMSGMLRKGEVVLPIHDSFMVRASKIGWLEEEMARAGREVGALPEPSLDRKIAL